jgi:hypothetical protein
MTKPDQQKVPSDREGLAPSSGKMPYQRPVLRVYGSVRTMTQGSVGPAGDGPGMNMATSDRRLKENIVRVGEHPLGMGLYLFDYKPTYRDAHGHGRRLGVMADEVEAVVPQAVLIRPDGYKMVDYGLLRSLTVH